MNLSPRATLKISTSEWWMLLTAYGISRFVLYGLGYVFYRLYHAELYSSAVESICRFDCTWYQRIVDFGYDTHPHWLSQHDGANWAFMPLYPMLAKALNYVFANTDLSLIVLTNIGFFVSLVMFLKALKQLQISSSLQTVGIWLICFSPYTVYSMSGYTEPLFIAFVTGCFIALYRQEWLMVAIYGCLAATTRNLGVMLVFSVLWVGVANYGFRSFFKLTNQSLKVICAIWTIPFGLFCYMAYLYFLTGDALAFGHVQVAWGRHLESPLYWLNYGFSTGGPKLYLAIAALVGLALNAYLIWRKRYAEGIFMFICLMLPLSSGVNAMPRYIVGLYPSWLAIVLLIERFPALKLPLLVVSACTSCFIYLAFMDGQFFTV